jgi:uncharacterized protein YbjT (DUF2867 family)
VQTAPRSDGVGMSTILLTGATGNVTSAVIRSLQGSGHRLIGLVRDPAKAKDLAAQGVELCMSGWFKGGYSVARNSC